MAISMLIGIVATIIDQPLVLLGIVAIVILGWICTPRDRIFPEDH